MENTAGVLGVGLGILILYFVLSGLIVGALARWLLPGPDPMSWPATIGYGLAGSFLGGIVGRLVDALGTDRSCPFRGRRGAADLVLSQAECRETPWY